MRRGFLGASACLCILVGLPAYADNELRESGHQVKHVLLISVDGLHALDHSNFHRRVWDPLLQAAKLPHGRFHALRHSFASALITDNQSPKLMQTLLGHHSAAFTLDVYSDLWPTAFEGIGERVAAMLFWGDGSKGVAVTPPDPLDGEPTEAQ